MTVSLDLTRPRAPLPPAKPNLTGLTRQALAQTLIEAEICDPAKARMRAEQLWRWMHHRGVTDFERMTNVAKETRAVLADRFVLERPQIA